MPRDRGQVLVETALTVLLFFTFLLAIFEGGRLLQTQQTLTQAAREGARYAVLPFTETANLPTGDEVRTMVRGYLQASAIEVADSDITVEPNVTIASSGGTTFTRVTVNYTYQFLILSWVGLTDLPLAGTSLMRNETSPPSW